MSDHLPDTTGWRGTRTWSNAGDARKVLVDELLGRGELAARQQLLRQLRREAPLQDAAVHVLLPGCPRLGPRLPTR